MIILIENGDSDEQKQMANALLANHVVRAIELARDNRVKVHKSDEEIKTAVLKVVGHFGVGAQWAAVYRVLVDICGWDKEITTFCKRMNTLLKGCKLHYPCTYQSIQKTCANNGILNKGFKEWQKYKAPKGSRVFPRQMHVARELLKLLSIEV